MLAQLLSYSPVLGILVLAKGPAQKDVAADFIVGFFIARIPILLFQAMQAALLPKLAALVGAGRHDDFRAGLEAAPDRRRRRRARRRRRRTSSARPSARSCSATSSTSTHVDLALLAAGSGLFILALTLAQALIALMGHARATYAWVAGNIAFWIVAVASGHDLFLRVELGFVAGCGVSALVMWVFLATGSAAGSPKSALADFVEQIEHEPLEI